MLVLVAREQARADRALVVGADGNAAADRCRRPQELRLGHALQMTRHRVGYECEVRLHNHKRSCVAERSVHAPHGLDLPTHLPGGNKMDVAMRE